MQPLPGVGEPSRSNLLDAVGIATMVVRPGDTAVASGDGDLAILSSAHALRIMEVAATAALSQYLELSETTVMTNFECTFLGPVGIGVDLKASATVVALDDRDGIEGLILECDIYDGSRQVAVGTMRREVVERIRYAAKVAALALISQESE
jgi:fluoroacetyl-CoA thioesterase